MIGIAARRWTKLACFGVIGIGMGASLGAQQAAQQGGLLGRWVEPGGSMIEVVNCGDLVCAKIASISKTAPARVDGLNPDAALRNRPLCGVEIGSGFKPVSADRAEGGTLYDPKSGKTYKGSLQRDGDKLALRGYVGLKLFGRTETWTRANGAEPNCKN